MDAIEIYKQLYYDEISRKKHSDGKLSTTMLFISLFIAGFGIAIFENSCLPDKRFSELSLDTRQTLVLYSH
jgi:hypothetical protein